MKRKDGKRGLPEMDMNTNPIWKVLDGGELPKKKKTKKKVKKKRKTQMDQDISDLFAELENETKNLTEKKLDKGKPNKLPLSWFYGVIIFLIVLIISFLTFISFKYSQEEMKSTSMAATITKKEKILYQADLPIQRFNIVLVERAGKKDFLRIVGMPGDKIRMEDDMLYINESVYDEVYLKANYINFKYDKQNAKKNYTENFDVLSIKKSQKETVPENKYLLLGDNRQEAVDSRQEGFYEKSEIKGVALMKTWPIFEMGPVE